MAFERPGPLNLAFELAGLEEQSHLMRVRQCSSSLLPIGARKPEFLQEGAERRENSQARVAPAACASCMA